MQSSPLLSFMIGGLVGRGAMRCIPTRPTEVAVGLIYPYFIAAAAGTKSRSRLINPVRRIEAIVTFKKQITAALLLWRKRKGKRKRKREN